MIANFCRLHNKAVALSAMDLCMEMSWYVGVGNATSSLFDMCLIWLTICI